MRRIIGLGLLLLPQTAAAQTACPGGTCVAQEDLQVFLQLAREQKCRSETLPRMTLDPITIVVDKDGRVFGSGNNPKPYQVRIDWCNYQLSATSQVQLVVGQQVEKDWGWRFRLKAAVGFLPVEAYTARRAAEGLDGGLLFEPFYYRWANVAAMVGFRSFGLGIGMDLTKNFGVHLGYAMSWQTWRSSPYAGFYFSFW